MNLDMIDEVAELFKALSEPMRLRLLLELKSGEKTVSQLSDFSGTTMANISKHLAFMKRAGLVERRKSGNLVYYSIRNSDILAMCDSICRDIEKRFESRKPSAAKKIKPMAARKPVAAEETKTVTAGKPVATEETKPVAAMKPEPAEKPAAKRIESEPERKPITRKIEPAPDRKPVARKIEPAPVIVKAEKNPPKPAEAIVAKPKKKAPVRKVEPDIHQPSLMGLDNKEADDNLTP